MMTAKLDEAKEQMIDHAWYPPSSGSAPSVEGGLDWFSKALAKPNRTGRGRQQQGKTVAPPPLSWMSKMKRRSSMDLEDAEVVAHIAQANAAAVPGGWLTTGTLGAPGFLEEEQALREARAASSLGR